MWGKGSVCPVPVGSGLVQPWLDQIGLYTARHGNRAEIEKNMRGNTHLVRSYGRIRSKGGLGEEAELALDW